MYWPKDENPVAYGLIEVQLEKEQIMANYTVRALKIKHLKVRGIYWWVDNVLTKYFAAL